MNCKSDSKRWELQKFLQQKFGSQSRAAQDLEIGERKLSRFINRLQELGEEDYSMLQCTLLEDCSVRKTNKLMK